MEENFFIDNPEKFENNFFNKELKREFQKSFNERSKEMVEVISKKHRHAKKMQKKRTKQQEQQSYQNHNNKMNKIHKPADKK